LGGPHSATIGMRVMDLELRTWSGAPGYFLLGAMLICFRDLQTRDPALA